MYILNDEKEMELIVKKSKFISKLYKINSINDVNTILEKLKKEYKDATHICYAYIFNNYEKYSDDNEPTGTAGLQVLNVLKKENITNTLGVVIRYFGGIKLGVGGLSRSYLKVTKECLKKCVLEEYIITKEIVLTTNLNNLKLLNSITKNLNIKEKVFNDTITYIIIIKESDLNSFTNSLKNTNIEYKVKED